MEVGNLRWHLLGYYVLIPVEVQATLYYDDKKNKYHAVESKSIVTLQEE